MLTDCNYYQRGQRMYLYPHQNTGFTQLPHADSLISSSHSDLITRINAGQTLNFSYGIISLGSVFFGLFYSPQTRLEMIPRST